MLELLVLVLWCWCCGAVVLGRRVGREVGGGGGAGVDCRGRWEGEGRGYKGGGVGPSQSEVSRWSICAQSGPRAKDCQHFQPHTLK